MTNKRTNDRPKGARFDQPRRSVFSAQQFGEIDFGEDDANIEYEISRHNDSKPVFIRAFYEHPQINLDDFRGGKKYLILGQKGTGKTAILRRLQAEIEEQGNLTHFMIFRDEVASYEELTKFGEVFSVSVNEVKKVHYHFYTIERLLLLVISSKLSAISDTDSGLSDSSVRSLLKRVVGKPLKRVVEIALETISDVAQIVEIDPSRLTNGRVGIDNSILLRTLNNHLFAACVQALRKEEKKIALFVDEIHFIYRLGHDHDQDAGLVRDLIRAVGKLNRDFRAERANCLVYAAVRSEYLDHPLISAAELHPVLSAYGSEISWATFSANFTHPMFEIGARRVDVQRHSGLTGKQFMTACFANFTNDRAAEFVQSTWSKPRDMVRFLRTCREMFPNKTTLTIAEYQQVFHKSCISARKEIETALTSFLTTAGVERIMQLLSECSSHSLEKGNLGNIPKFTKNLAPIAKKETQAGSVHEPESLFKLLYMLGVVYTVRPISSQTLPIMHSYHRGNPNPDPDGFVAIHRAIAKSFS